jgi:RimJ/RimL family protein N-acetyltransferase
MRLETERLVLRPWRDADLEPFAAMSADPEVMAHFPATLDRAGTEAFVARIHARAAEDGIAFQPIERRADGAFLGFAGLARVRAPEALAGAVEIGWRLARPYWGMGYATEAAAAWRDAGFARLGLSELVAFTATGNLPSQAVARRIGMRHDPTRDFDHPALPEGHRLRRHLLFAMARPGAAGP